MAYTKTNWQAGVTPCSEENMNHLETQYDEAISALEAHEADVSTHGVTKVAGVEDITDHAADTSTHGAADIADKSDIAVDANLSAAAQDAVTKRHTRAHDMNGASDHNPGTAGDILYAGAGGAWSKLAKGAENQRLVQGSSYPAWQYDVVAIECCVGDGSNVVTTGIKHRIKVPFSGTIIAWEVGADQSGSITFDVWKDSYANYPPTVADTITASDKPKTTSAIKGQGSCSGWTVAITAGDWIFVNVDSCTTIKQATLVLTLRKGL